MGTASQAGAACVIVMAVACPKPRHERIPVQARTAGTHKTSSIRVAEAAKVIENTQRDVNIALVNEPAMLFNKLGKKS